jgi:hypothetical protein
MSEGHVADKALLAMSPGLPTPQITNKPTNVDALFTISDHSATYHHHLSA